MHGLVYKTFIADGDSNVALAVENTYKEEGDIVVNKIQCKNHAIRRLNYNLYKLNKNTQFSSSDRNILEKRIPSIGKACIYAIEINSEQLATRDADQLKYDLSNTLFHCFGDHSKCKKHVCLDGIAVVPEKMKRPDYKAPIRAAPLVAENRNVVSYLEGRPIWIEIKIIIDRLSGLSDSLIMNMTSNIAESFKYCENDWWQKNKHRRTWRLC